MDQIHPEYQAVKKETDWMSILQLVFSLGVLAFSILIVLATIFGKAMVSQTNLAKDLGASVDPMLVVFACTAFVIGSAALVSAICSGRRMVGKPYPAWLQAKMPWLYGAIFVLPVLLLLGLNLFRIPKYSDAWMPIFSILCIFTAGIWYMRIGYGRDWGKSPQRDSGLLTFSFGFTTILIMVTELLALAIFGVVFLLITLQDPEVRQLILTLPSLLQGVQADSLTFQKIIQELIAKPIVVFATILLIAFLIPLIEELLKTIGVFLLKGRNLNPREGMLAGIVSGAGFGIVEGMLFAIQAGPGTEPITWVIFVIGRAAALILHIFNGALNGFALVRFWQNRKAAPLIGTFLISLLIHGTWNLISVLGSTNFLDQSISAGITISIFLIVFTSYIIFTRKVSSPTQEIVINNEI